MNAAASEPVSLTSQWFIRPGCKEAAFAALDELAAAVQAGEPDTLTYLVHAPYRGDERLKSLPPTAPGSVVFFEVYRNAEAFEKHVDGPIFTAFVARFGELFVEANGKPFTFVNFLSRHAGFVRPVAEPGLTVKGEAAAGNRHPSVMFEVMAKDQAKLQGFYQSAFGWEYSLGTDNFAYVKFPLRPLPLLGGIGQAAPGVPGLDPGHNFYLLVEDLESAIARASQAGGSVYMEPTTADGYHFAMIKDPEGNPVGLITPFSAETIA